MKNSLAWCQSATWSSTDLPSANMSTRRCENIRDRLSHSTKWRGRIEFLPPAQLAERQRLENSIEPMAKAG